MLYLEIIYINLLLTSFCSYKMRGGTHFGSGSSRILQR